VLIYGRIGDQGPERLVLNILCIDWLIKGRFGQEP
jgi:hypothetical protein